MNSGLEDFEQRHRSSASAPTFPKRALSILVALFMVFTAAPYLSHSSFVSAENVSIPQSSASMAENERALSLGQKPYDWAGLADDSGLVNVIIQTPDFTSPKLYLDSLVETQHASVSSSAFSALRETVLGSCQREFTNVFHGVAATLSPSMIDTLLSLDESIQVYPDYAVNATLTDSVPAIGADQIWSRTDDSGNHVTGLGITVAIIDTGVDYTHPDLGGGFGPGYKVKAGYDFVNDDSDPKDDNGHGTHVAGIVAANGGILGVAPDAEILAYKCLDSSGSGSMSDVILSIEAATDPNGDGDTSDHADIISMSLGGAGEVGDPVTVAVENAIAEGVVVIIAAGNSGPYLSTVDCPGLTPAAITVGAVDNSGNLASFSSRGPIEDLVMKPEISAPGVGIRSTVPYSGASSSSPTGYMVMSGTSMATPHVSGAAALLIQLHPDWAPAEIKSALVMGANQIDESLWEAGAGMLWVPGAADMQVFSSIPLISYGLASSSSITFNIYGESTSFSTDSEDWYALSADGSVRSHAWTNLSSVTPLTVMVEWIPQGTLILSVSSISDADPEGYYEGHVLLSGSSSTIRIPFGFAILSKLTVHVLDQNGQEVYDPYGGVWLYDIPDANVAMGRRGDSEPSPPATFLIPSGTYSVHAAGHHLIYVYSNTYMLATVVTVARLSTIDVFMSMSEAHPMVLDLETDGGQPIYVKDFRMYGRYVGLRNISFDFFASDLLSYGSELFSLPHSATIYVSDTESTVGVAIVGYAYSSAMWSFMTLNWQHWYEFISGASTDFQIPASTDQEYMLAWEMDGVTGSTPLTLGIDPGLVSVYTTKYDIPGNILNPWQDWGVHTSLGGEATFYLRRDTPATVNPFFSGMIRDVFVQGVFSQLYFPLDLFGGFVEQQFYTPDYDYLVRASSGSDIYLPNRNYLTPVSGLQVDETLCDAPYYPSVRAEVNSTTMLLYQPLLRDQSGAKVGGMTGPRMDILIGGLEAGVYLLAEHLARPDAVREVDLFGSGTYIARIEYQPTSQVSNSFVIDLGFTVPSADATPPYITGFIMPQKFVAGSSVPIHLTAEDAVSSVSATVSVRSGSGSPWSSVTVTPDGSGGFSASIPTTNSYSSIDLKVRVQDASGNYIEYTVTNAALKQIPVQFDISASLTEVEYKVVPVTTILSGYLRDANGDPLDATAAVPLDLFVGGEKVAMILDDYVVQGSHTHDGNIRFDWTLDPMTLFSHENETITVTVTFDLGIYQAVTRSFTLHSIPNDNTPPQVTLVSPEDGSLVAAGTMINLDVTDDTGFTVRWSLDGGPAEVLASPWDISTVSWSEGVHSIEVTATDEDLVSVASVFTFDVDADSPDVAILTPADGSQVPTGYSMTIDASDAHLFRVTYSLDSGAPVVLSSPYVVDMGGWSAGSHEVVVTAEDAVGHISTASISFEIVDSNILVSLVSPADGSVIKSGVSIVLSVLGAGVLTVIWREGTSSQILGSQHEISTVGWSEGSHDIVVNATNDFGDSYEISFTVTIDDTPPVLALVSPMSGAFVTSSDTVTIHSDDLHYANVSWSVWGMSGSSSSRNVIISLNFVDTDGMFTVDVVSSDLAGNTALESFAFSMDQSDPVLYVDGASDGGAVASGTPLSLVAEDAFLSSVTCSLDGGSPATVASPFALPVDLGLGWHELTAEASDYSGRSSQLDISFYLDGTSPSVEIVSGSEFRANRTFEVRASVVDDFGVESVVLWASLQSGGNYSASMELEGDVYSVDLPAEILWDGITIYVVASDAVGNLEESDHIVLSVSQSSGGGSLNPEAIISWFGSLAGILSLILVAVVAVALVVLSSRRRRREDDFFERKHVPPLEREVLPVFEPSTARLYIEPGPEKPAVVPWMEAEAVRRPEVMAAEQEFVEQVPVEEEREEQVESEPSPPVTERFSPSLIDAIPVVPVIQEKTAEEYDAEYDQMLKDLEDIRATILHRQIGLSLMEDKDGNMLDLDELLKDDRGGPQFVSGLHLKKLMEKEEPKRPQGPDAV